MDFCVPEFFFVRFLVLRYGQFCIQQWITVNWKKNTEKILANLIQTLTSEDRVSIQKNGGSRGEALLAYFFYEFVLVLNAITKVIYKIDLISKNKHRTIKKNMRTIAEHSAFFF